MESSLICCNRSCCCHLNTFTNLHTNIYNSIYWISVSTTAPLMYRSIFSIWTFLRFLWFLSYPFINGLFVQRTYERKRWQTNANTNTCYICCIPFYLISAHNRFGWAVLCSDGIQAIIQMAIEFSEMRTSSTAQHSTHIDLLTYWISSPSGEC